MSNEEEKIETTETKKPRRTKKWLWILLVLIVLIVVLAYLYLKIFIPCGVAHQQQLGELADTQNQIQQLRSEAVDAKKTADAAMQTAQDLNNKLTQVQAAKTANQNEWLIAEAKYFVKLANDKVQFENNVPEAILLLKTVDQSIRSLSDPKLEEVRKALAVDIANLQSVPVVDVTGFYLRLSALNGKIDELPLINKPTISPAQNPAEVNAPNPSWWQRGLKASWESLRQIVVIRYNETGKLPLIPPDQQAYFYQNLHAVLLQAMWALLHGQNDIFRTSLGQASSWINEYAVPNSSITQAMLTDLSQLEKTDIHPAVPKITTLEVFVYP